MKIIKMSEQQFREWSFGLGNPGVCLSCGYADEYAGCEPDAQNYECPDCGENQLFGLEEALMMGRVEII